MSKRKNNTNDEGPPKKKRSQKIKKESSGSVNINNPNLDSPVLKHFKPRGSILSCSKSPTKQMQRPAFSTDNTDSGMIVMNSGSNHSNGSTGSSSGSRTPPRTPTQRRSIYPLEWPV